MLTSRVFVQSTEEPRSDRSPIKDITVQIIDLVSKHNGNSTIIKAITGVRVHQTPSPKTGKKLCLDFDCLKFSKNYAKWFSMFNVSKVWASLVALSVCLEKCSSVERSLKSLKPWNVT